MSVLKMPWHKWNLNDCHIYHIIASVKKLLSLAKSIRNALFITLCKSFTGIKNKKGHGINPLGTDHVTL